MRIAVFGGALLGFAWTTAVGQQASPHFEVASIRAADPQTRLPNMQGGPGTPDPGRITYTSLSLSSLVSFAYDVPGDRISGPPWLATQRFDIQAKVPDGSTQEELRVMLQNLLAERFRLSFHRMKKEFQVYELLQAKSGAKLKPGTALDDGKPTADGRGGLAGSNGFPVPPAHQTAQRSANGVAKMGANQVTMARFAQFLGIPAGFLSSGNTPEIARVTDKTGLEGEFSFTLEYEWPGPKPPNADPGDLAPDLLTALQQQLGLRLNKTKQELDVLVIDRAEKTPAEN